MNLNDNFRSLNCGIPDIIRKAESFGDFNEASRLIELELKKGTLTSGERGALIAHSEIVRRLPANFIYSREEALNIIREKVPDFSEAEFDAYCDSGKVRWIYINGQKRYFDRFFQTLCKTDPSFSARAGVTLPGVESATAQSQANSAVNRSMAIMKDKGYIAHRIHIKASVKINDSAFVPGSKVRMWIPVPASCDSQAEISILSCNPGNYHIGDENDKQRTVFWETKLEKNEPFSVEFSYVSCVKYNDTDIMKECNVEQPCFMTEEIPPHVVFSPVIRDLAAKLSEGCNGPLEKARAFYDYITKNMSYTFMPSYFVMEDIAERCARNMTGDCGVFAILFMTLCRAAGIPAHWESGWVTEPGFVGAHDWVRFYVAPYGWLYADPSFGTGAVRVKNEERRRFYFGNIDAYRMVANREFMADLVPPSEGWRSDPYDNQLGEVEINGRGLTSSEYSINREILSFDEDIEFHIP